MNIATAFAVTIAGTFFECYAEGDIFAPDEEGQAIEVEVTVLESVPEAPSAVVDREMKQFAADRLISQYWRERGQNRD